MQTELPIALGCDHGGYELKETIKAHLSERGIPFVDFGTDGPASVDYPDYAVPPSQAVVRGECRCALLFCTTGVGISMAANKVRGIRCALCSDTYSARMTRAHNDANMLAMGGRVIGPCLACDIVDSFLSAEFEGGRHLRRVEQIADIERRERGEE